MTAAGRLLAVLGVLALSAPTREQPGAGAGTGTENGSRDTENGGRRTGHAFTVPVPRDPWDVPASVPAPAPGFLGETKPGPWSGWQSIADEATGRPWVAYGPGIAIDEASAVASLAPDVDAIARRRVSTPQGEVVLLEQRIRGVPVDAPRAQLRYVNGKLAFARLAFIDTDVDPIPSIGAEAAREIAGSEAGEPRLVIARGEDSWRLAWALRADRLDLRIDAHDGSILSIDDGIRSSATLQVEGWYEPRRATDAQVLAPFGFVNIKTSAGSYVADTSGSATIDAPSTALVEMKGLYADISFVSDSGSVASIAVPDGGTTTLTLGSALAPAERAAYRHRLVSRARMKEMAPDVEWVDERVNIVVDVPDSFGCNAFWDGIANSASFFAESEECNATGRIADVVYHELGHGFHQHLSIGGVLAGDIGEGSADYVSATITNDPDIGPSFFKDVPEGIRNLEPDRRIPEDQVGQVHTDGLIWGGAFWDLRTDFKATLGTDAGIALADRIFADTLRYDPTLEDGFYDVLFAADDDGDLANGVPNLCSIVSSFGAHGLGPGDRLVVSHLPIGAQDPARGSYDVRVRARAAFPECFEGGAAALSLEWRLAGESAWRVSRLHDDLVPGWQEGSIPAQAEGSLVEYRLSALDALGRVETAPAFNFATAPFRFPVGKGVRVFFDDFENDLGWTHVLIEGPDQLGADDWQRGVPRGRAGDPLLAWSGTSVIGNDLGDGEFNGAYQPGVHNRLTSPSIDCRGCLGTRLRFRRWLNVEDSEHDHARVLVGNEVVWENPETESLRDRAWRFEEIAIPQADGERFRLRFEMETSHVVQAGGWTLDDLEIVADSFTPVTNGCSCGLTSQGRQRGVALAALVGLLTCVIRRRRDS